MGEVSKVFSGLMDKISWLRGSKKVANQPANTEQAKSPETLREQNIGKLFEEELRISKFMPAILDQSGGASGLLETNEDLSDALIEEVKASAPDGYIVGPGFGNILAMTLFFSKESPPKAILSMDISPGVVMTGRVVTQLLEQSEDFWTFYHSLSDRDMLENIYDQVISGETNDRIQQRLSQLSKESMFSELDRVLGREFVPETGYRMSVSGSNNKRLGVLAVIKDQYDLLHSLAKEGNIGVGYADITDSSALEIVNNMPGLRQSKNVVYMSNVIDHLTDRGCDLTHIDDMDVLQLLDNQESFFVDTTQRSLDYQLRVNRHVPTYLGSELEFRSWFVPTTQEPAMV